MPKLRDDNYPTPPEYCERCPLDECAWVPGRKCKGFKLLHDPEFARKVAIKERKARYAKRRTEAKMKQEEPCQTGR